MAAGAVPIGIARTWADPRLMLVLLLGTAMLLTATFTGILLHYAVIWARGLIGGAHVPYVDILRIRLRGVVPSLIVNNCVKAARAGREVDWRPLVEHDLEDGNVRNVVAALIAAHDWDVPLTQEQAMELDAAGYDVLSEVERARRPRELTYGADRAEDPPLALQSADGRSLAVRLHLRYRHVPAALLARAEAPEQALQRAADAAVREARRRKMEEGPEHFLAQISRSLESANLDAGTSCDILSVTIEKEGIAAGP